MSRRLLVLVLCMLLGGTATVRIHIDWPELPSSRILLSTLHHVDISVTGSGIT